MNNDKVEFQLVSVQGDMDGNEVISFYLRMNGKTVNAAVLADSLKTKEGLLMTLSSIIPQMVENL